MPERIKIILSEFVENVKVIYGSHLKKIILFGSYARGDFNESSDIDIMLLLDISDIDLKRYSTELCSLVFDYEMNYNVDINPIAKNEGHFNKWENVYPFYANVSREGIFLYEAA